MVFLTNGFDTRIDDGAYPERRVASIYSRRDLDKLFNLRAMRTSLTCVAVNKDVAGRWYQVPPIDAACMPSSEEYGFCPMSIVTASR